MSVSIKTTNMKYIFFAAILFLFASCKDSKAPKNSEATAKKVVVKENVAGDQKAQDSLNQIFGYRFEVWGDFNGDGNRESLVEHYYSRRDGKEAYKFYDNVEDDYDILDLVMAKEPYSFATSSNALIDTLRISSVSQLYGIAYLKNEGDLNGDGTEEVSYVTDYADMSSLNTWHIMTYDKEEWKELYSFPIWDWQLPATPGIVTNFGLFGSEGKSVIPENDTLNKRIERELKAFPGLVKKLAKNKIQVIYRNEEADEDTLVVRLKKV
jgi:hypothetical protein